METLDYIKKLVPELKFTIFEFIDIDTRVEYMSSIYSVQTFTDYLHAIPIDQSIRLFEVFIQNKLLYKQTVHNSFRWWLKDNISNLLPTITINHLSALSNKKTYYHDFVFEISRICNLRYIPRNTTNVTIRNLEWKKREFINDKNYQVFNAFSTLTTSNKTLAYIIKKTLLYYMIAIILYTKKNYELQKIKNQHKIIKRWLKKVLPKPLKQSVREYNKRAKVREKERQKQMRIIERQKKKEANELKKIKLKEERRLEQEKAKIKKIN